MKPTSSLAVILFFLSPSVSATKRPNGADDGIYIEFVHADCTTVMDYYGPANSMSPVYAFDKHGDSDGYPVFQSPEISRSDIVAAVNRLGSFLRGDNVFYAKSVFNYHGGAVA